MKKCNGCGTLISPGEVCPICGRSQRRRWLKAILILLSILLLLLPFGFKGVQYINQQRMEDRLQSAYQFLEAEDYPQASLAFKQVLEEQEDNVDVRLGYIESLMGMGELEQALGQVQRLLAIDPSIARAHFLLVEIYLDTGDALAALESLMAGEDVVGAKVLQELRHRLEQFIVLEESSQRQVVGKEITLCMKCQRHPLAAEWTVEGDGQLTVLPDGSAEVSSQSPGQVVVTAQYSSFTRETTLDFSQAPGRVKSAEKLVEDFNYPFMVPPFEAPQELDDEVLLILLLNWVNRYTDEGDQLISATAVERAAEQIFGWEKELPHQSVWLANWDPHEEFYEIIGMGLPSVTVTYILGSQTTADEYIVDAVHLVRDISWHEDDEAMYDIYDEEDNYLGTYYYEELDEAFDQDNLAQLPQRRYIFKRQGDGFYLLKSVRR